MKIEDYIRAVMIAVGWCGVYAMAAGIILFYYIASSQKEECVKTYERYIQEVDAKCTFELPTDYQTLHQFDPIKNQSFWWENLRN